MRLAVLDDPFALELSGPQHDKKDIVVDIQFGALMRLIGVLDHQLVKPELGLDLGQQLRVGFVQTQPNDPAVAAGKSADFPDRDVPYPLAVTVERAGNDPWSGDIGDDEIEYFSQRFSSCGRVYAVRGARCRGLRGSD